jgi:hypothetical protein
LIVELDSDLSNNGNGNLSKFHNVWYDLVTTSLSRLLT